MELDFYILGTLAEEEHLHRVNSNYKSIKITHQTRDIQFYIQILNHDDIQKEYLKEFKNNFAIGYENQIDNREWDEIKKGALEYELTDKFRSFCSDKIFIFKPYLKDGLYGDPRINIAHNTLDVAVKPEGFNGTSENSLITIPIFKEFNKYNFEKRLLENKSIGRYNSLDQLPSCIISGDYIYGEIDDSKNLNDGWHVQPLDSFKKLAIDFEEYQENLLIHHNSIYFDYQFFNDVILEEGLLKLGEEVSLDNKIKIKKNINEEYENEPYIEEDFLGTFKEHVANNGLLYDEKQLVNFHTAFKTKKLVILTGPSGTGKTQLVNQYAEALGIKENGKTQLKMIPVKPSWRDDSDLVGFLDTINNIYRPSESGLIDVIIEANRNRDKLYIVCFDEMNLAKIEYYFSQFLSILEMNPNDRILSLYSKNLVSRVFNGDQYPHEVKVLSNILFVGTINNDETTETISDKVLDRSNYIEMTVPKNHIKSWALLQSHKDKKKELRDYKEVSVQIYNEWSHNDNVVNLNNKELDILNRINELLVSNNAKSGIGYRIINHINSYISNLPKNTELSREEAFDLQISQKIIPKIRGTVEELQDIFDENGLVTVLTDEEYPYSYQSINEKIKELDLNGYTY